MGECTDQRRLSTLRGWKNLQHDNLHPTYKAAAQSWLSSQAHWPLEPPSLLNLLTASCQTNSPHYIKSRQFRVEITTQVHSLNLGSPLHFCSHHLWHFSYLPYCCQSCWPMVSYFNLFWQINKFWQNFLKYIFCYFEDCDTQGKKSPSTCLGSSIYGDLRQADWCWCWERMFGTAGRGNVWGIFSSWNSEKLQMGFGFQTPWWLESLLSFTSRMKGRRLCWWAQGMWSYHNCIHIVFTEVCHIVQTKLYSPCTTSRDSWEKGKTLAMTNFSP